MVCKHKRDIPSEEVENTKGKQISLTDFLDICWHDI